MLTPSPSSFRDRRIALFLPLGFASGLPLLLCTGTLSAWLQNRGVDLSTIGAFSLVGLPYSVKFLWAPLLDRYALPGLGRRRGWLLLLQVAVTGALGALGVLGPAVSPLCTACLALMVALLSASQDIVIDALRADLLTEEQRAPGAATYVLGYRAGMLAAGALALTLSAVLSWRSVYLIMAALMLATLPAGKVVPEPAAGGTPHTLVEAMVRPYTDYFSRPRAVPVLLFVLLYRLGDSVALPMIMPFLLRTGFGNAEVGAINQGLGILAMALGALLGGGLTARIGVWRGLLLFGGLQALTNAGYLALALYGRSHLLLLLVIACDNLCGGLATAAFVAFLMSLCTQRYSATQYALLSSASGVCGRLLGAASGYLAAALGWPLFFAATMVLALPGLVLLRWVPGEQKP